MLVILQGSLRHFPAEELLPFIAHHRHSGTLDVEVKGWRARLFFRDGDLICGESSSGDDVVAIVASFSGEQEGQFAFLDGVELPPTVTEVPRTVDSVLEEAQRRAVVARTFPDDARFRVVEAPAGKEISLKPEQFKLLLHIGAGRAFGELIADGDTTREELAAAIRALEAGGLLVRIDHEPSPAVAAAHETKAPSAGAPAAPAVKDEPAKPELKKRAGSLTSSGADAAVHPLIGNAYTIGRDAHSDIVVADASVSSKHARISRSATGFLIEDLGSRNGTFVNGEPVKQSVALADNDMVRLGKIIFTFNLAAELKTGETTETNLERS